MQIKVATFWSQKPMTGVEWHQSSVTPATETVFCATVSLRSFRSSYVYVAHIQRKAVVNTSSVKPLGRGPILLYIYIWSWTLLEKKSCSLHALWCKIIASKNQDILWKQHSIPPRTYFYCLRYFHILEKRTKGWEEDIFSFNVHEESEEQRKAVLQNVPSHNPHIC